ncbi:MAG: DUF87 domain-containing protein [Nanoarchaeota archaeon]|nr:DUF87 domain-containing protein [Nanoarchaeota archaeon]MBU1854886.1 DUF87 domain-containing protein [Nanoarchaeota archaeon]
MKAIEQFAKTALIFFLIVLALSGIIMTKEYFGWVTYHEGEAGNIYEMILDLRSPAFLWTAIYGVAVRFEGFTYDAYYELEGGGYQSGYLEANLLFDCLEPGIEHEVYTSTKPSAEIDFASLEPATPEEIDAYLGTAEYDSLTQMMSAVNTYDKNITVAIGANILEVPGTYTYKQDGSSLNFDVGILKDSSGTFVFVSHILSNITRGFNNRLYNYQMMIPIKNSSIKTPFYFFTDPYDICPAGEGELPNPGEVKGLVTTESGQPIEQVIIDVAGYTGVTNSSGGYNVTVPAGFYRIYAIKAGYETYSGNVSVQINETTIYNIILVPEVNELQTDVGPGVDIGPGKDDGPGEDVGPGEAPLVPIVEQPKRIEGTDYIISLNAVNRKIRVGNFLQEDIRIFSFKESTTEVSFEVTGSVAELIDLDKNKLLVAPNTQDGVTLTIFGRGQPGIYNGTIEISGDLNASIPVIVELLTKEQLSVQALLMDLDISKKDLHPNEELRLKLDLKNLLSDQQYPVTLFFTVQDEEGNTTLWTYSTNVFLRTSFSLLKTIKLPKEAKAGVYIVRVSASYLGFSSGTSAVFNVVTPFFQRFVWGLFVWQWSLILLLLLSLIIAAIIIRQKMEQKKRFHLKVEYSELPKPGPRSGSWGKIAESDHKTYFDLEQLKIHTIVAGSTGGGKSISAQVIVEECLLKDVAVLVFDPTAQWSGMLRPCKEKGMLKYYPGFGMKTKDARSFNGNVRQLMNAKEVIEIHKYMKPGEIQIFAMNKLDPKAIDTVVANTIRQIFKENFNESTELRLLVVYDEIHRILPKFGGSGDGFVQIERGCREFRKWGVGVMLVSQVLADFVGQIKANINTEVQMRTRDEGDLERIKTKHGDEVLKSLVRASVGSGMVQNASYNRGRPYFVTFRPILHSVQRLSDEELEKYNGYNEEIDQMMYELEQLEELEVDVFDMKLEIKLALDKVKSGNFNMVEVYLEGIRPRMKKEWGKIGKTPKKKEIMLVSDDELKEAIESAKKSREDYVAKEQKNVPEEKKKEEDFFRKEVAPEKILNLFNGMLVISMKGLYDELAAMKQSDFEQHVNKDKNDFAEWVKNAVGDEELAKHIALKKDKNEILDLLTVRKDNKKLPKFSVEENKLLEAETWFEVGNASSVETKNKQDNIVEKPKTESKVKVNAEINTKQEPEKEIKVKSETSEKVVSDNTITEDGEFQSEKVSEQVANISEFAVDSEDSSQKKSSESNLESVVNDKTLSPDEYFRLSSGRELKSVFDLVDYLRNINDDEFKQYVNDNKNDFANWIRGVFHNDRLADKISVVKEKDELIGALQEG